MVAIHKELKDFIAKSESVKARLAKLFVEGGKGDIDALSSKLDATPVTVKTSLFDLRSSKYCIGSPLNIVKDEKGVYSIGDGKRKPTAAPAAKPAKKAAKTPSKPKKSAKAPKGAKEQESAEKAPESASKAPAKKAGKKAKQA
jgi:hypothetical protein